MSALETVVGDGGLHLPTGRDTEKFFYTYRTPEWRFAANVGGHLALRAARDSARTSGRSAAAEVRLQGHFRNLAGFYTETFDGANQGDPLVLLRDPDLRPLYYPQVQPALGQFDRSTAALRIGGRVFAEIAHARLPAGNTFGESLVLSSTPDYFSFVRIGARTRRVGYTFVHGALGDRNRLGYSDLPDSAGIIVSGNERYLGLHRVDIALSDRYRVAFTEMVIYGRRGVELAYLNPVNPFKTSEHALYDRDNTLFALEATANSGRGLEAFGSVLVDDFDLGAIGKHDFGNKWALQSGVGWTMPLGMGWVEYTRVEPFVYTHRFYKDGSFYNAYTHNGFGLGHPIGPNADQWEAGARLWGRSRTTVEARVRVRRWGRNYTTPEGTFVNVGGDLGNGTVPDRTPAGVEVRNKYFLAGDLVQGPGGQLALSWEPVRSAVLVTVLASAQRWSGDTPSEAFLRFDVRLRL